MQKTLSAFEISREGRKITKKLSLLWIDRDTVRETKLSRIGYYPELDE